MIKILNIIASLLTLPVVAILASSFWIAEFSGSNIGFDKGIMTYILLAVGYFLVCVLSIIYSNKKQSVLLSTAPIFYLLIAFFVVLISFSVGME
jgi:hypothetical protein